MPTAQLGMPTEPVLRAMQRLAAQYPKASTHAVDLPYRLAWARPGQSASAVTALWYAPEEQESLAAWAVWAPGSWTVEAAAHPSRAAALWPEILAWGEAHARELAHLRGVEAAAWSVSARSDDAERIALLEANGFQRKPWSTVHYERSLSEPPPPPTLPAGFVLRPLRGEAEVPSYVTAHRAAFNSTNMSDEWRRRTLTVPGYHPDLDLVVAAPDGRVVAFAILWLGPEWDGRREGQFEPVGVHPDFHRRGLGRALMLEGMRRLRDAGATHALVQTETTRTAANALYSSVMHDTGVRTVPFAKSL